MQCLTTDLVSQACRIFLALAYPAGESAIPAKKRILLGLPSCLDIFEFMGNEPAMLDCCQSVCSATGESRALLIRVGCKHYPHLKLKAQLVGEEEKREWLFSVDTHDAYSSTTFLPPPDHPDAGAWRTVQAANVALKEKIEAA